MSAAEEASPAQQALATPTTTVPLKGLHTQPHAAATAIPQVSDHLATLHWLKCHPSNTHGQFNAHPFSAPALQGEAERAEYRKAVAQPLCLDQIEAAQNEFPSTKAFCTAVNLVFVNAMAFNRQGSKIHRDASDLLKEFKNLCKEQMHDECGPNLLKFGSGWPKRVYVCARESKEALWPGYSALADEHSPISDPTSTQKGGGAESPTSSAPGVPESEEADAPEDHASDRDPALEVPSVPQVPVQMPSHSEEQSLAVSVDPSNAPMEDIEVPLVAAGVGGSLPSVPLSLPSPSSLMDLDVTHGEHNIGNVRTPMSRLLLDSASPTARVAVFDQGMGDSNLPVEKGPPAPNAHISSSSAVLLPATPAAAVQPSPLPNEAAHLQVSRYYTMHFAAQRACTQNVADPWCAVCVCVCVCVCVSQSSGGVHETSSPSTPVRMQDTGGVLPLPESASSARTIALAPLTPDVSILFRMTHEGCCRCDHN